LHIVVTINEEVRTFGTFAARRLRDDDGVAFGRAELGFEADVATAFHQPVGARDEILLVFGLRGDAGKAEVIAQFINEPRFVLLQVIEDRLHARFVAGESANLQASNER